MSSNTVAAAVLFLTELERDLEVLHSLEDLNIQEDQNAVFMCEVSLADAPGEWFKNGEKIKPTSTIRIRQEGMHSSVLHKVIH